MRIIIGLVAFLVLCVLFTVGHISTPTCPAPPASHGVTAPAAP
ncbi:hypothetical protein [Amycolatopsis minnesotensis]|uniref:Uncharacterized protein n=1 Tax=Amycolatopsis minnesotensis TaxID=337894 RepID=A0ABP5DUD2_9PSEU